METKKNAFFNYLTDEQKSVYVDIENIIYDAKAGEIDTPDAVRYIFLKYAHDAKNSEIISDK